MKHHTSYTLRAAEWSALFNESRPANIYQETQNIIQSLRVDYACMVCALRAIASAEFDIERCRGIANEALIAIGEQDAQS